MNTSKFTRTVRRITSIPRKVVAIVFGPRPEPITSEEAERIDRIRNPHKYLAEVNAAKEI